MDTNDTKKRDIKSIDITKEDVDSLTKEDVKLIEFLHSMIEKARFELFHPYAILALCMWVIIVAFVSILPIKFIESNVNTLFWIGLLGIIVIFVLGILLNIPSNLFVRDLRKPGRKDEYLKCFIKFFSKNHV